MSRNSSSPAELGLIVALRIALRSTWIIWRNDHLLSQGPIRWRNSCASGSSWPALTYHTMITLCIDHTHGASFSTLCWQKCCGASRSMTCLLARNSTSMDHRQANCVITQAGCDLSPALESSVFL